ncbi:MAG TPA: hypothetical protein PKW41_09300 [Clostridia bacterium]|nr:hypothetical protein [Clostridia bacterium]HPK16180.1 hypothetical protein [Clostridia bacterium]
MIINRNGATFEHEGITYTIGAPIVATDQSEYEGLTGHIFEIRDGADKETENETPDLYCSFDPPNDPAEIAKLEAVFSDLYCTPKTLEDIALDLVIMAPDMVRPQKHADPKRLQSDVYQSIAEGKPCSKQARLVFDQVKVLSDAISAESHSQEVKDVER